MALINNNKITNNKIISKLLIVEMDKQVQDLVVNKETAMILFNTKESHIQQEKTLLFMPQHKIQLLSCISQHHLSQINLFRSPRTQTLDILMRIERTTEEMKKYNSKRENKAINLLLII